MSTDWKASCRPECFDFALDVVGDPEATELRLYVEALEARCTAVAQAEPQGPSDEELLELLSRASGLPEPDSYIVDGGRIMSEPCEILSFARAVLARWGRPAIEPVAWCSSQDFQDAALKRQSFNGWRERHSDCDLALYAHTLPVPQQEVE
jgi:hypothetical protein